MSTATDVAAVDVESIDLGDLALWVDGPPHEIFERLRNEAPVHWSPMASWPGEDGFWSITRAEDLRRVSLDWQTFSSERGGILVTAQGVPVEAQNGMFIAQDPPRHDRMKMLFQQGFTPRRIAEHEERIRTIAVNVLDGLQGRDEVELVNEVGRAVVGRVIGSFLGTPPEDDAAWAELAARGLGIGDPELQPEGIETVQKVLEEVFARVTAMIGERREHPTDDLTSVLVHAEVEGERLEDHEIVMGFALLVAAGNDSTKATFSNGMLGLLQNRDEMQKLIDDPAKIEAAVEEFLRMYPAFAHFRRTATRDVELRGKTIREGDKVLLWYPSGNRDAEVYECPHKLDVERNPQHQAFGAGGRHFCLGAALARLELKILFEETLKRYPNMELIEEPPRVRSLFLNQPRELRVRPNG